MINLSVNVNKVATLRNARGRDAHDAGMYVNAGHDLNLKNLYRLQELSGIKEVSIGHALITYALYFGLSQAVKNFRNSCGQKI